VSQNRIAVSLTVLEIQRKKWTGGYFHPPVAGMRVKAANELCSVAQLYGRQWRQSPPGARGKGAPRADSIFFILFNYKILSRFVAANDTALNTLRPIRPCFTANNNQLGL